jgi:hypothetical protein
MSRTRFPLREVILRAGLFFLGSGLLWQVLAALFPCTAKAFTASNLISKAVARLDLGAPDFTFTAGMPGHTFPGGQTVSLLSVAAVDGFTGTITFACGSFSPVTTQGVMCSSIAPVSLTETTLTATSTLTISTTAATSSLVGPPRFRGKTRLGNGLPAGGAFVVASLVALILPRRPIRCWPLLFLVLLVNGCGSTSRGMSNTNQATAPGVYSVPVIATSGALVHTAIVSFTVNFDSF